MKFVDTAAEYKLFIKEIQKRHRKILKSGIFLFGEQLEELEQNFQKVSNKKYNVAVKNCTDAIIFVLMKLGKSPVILPNFGAYPTAVAARGLTDLIYYVDVDETLTIDPNKLPKFQGGVIIPVHLFGNNCNMPEIMKHAKEHNMVVIEDCAQSTGSGSGGIGDYSVFSFYPTKPLSSMGDGGMICFDNEEDLDFFKKIRFYGQKGSDVFFPGMNSRMDEFQAAVVNSKIDKFQELNQKRKEIAKRYRNIIHGIKDNNSVYHQFVVLFNNRDEIIKELIKRKIPYMIHYYNHLSEINCLKGTLYNDVGVRLNDKAISLPIHPYLKEKEIQKIEKFLEDFKKYEFIFP